MSLSDKVSKRSLDTVTKSLESVMKRQSALESEMNDGDLSRKETATMTLKMRCKKKREGHKNILSSRNQSRHSSSINLTLSVNFLHYSKLASSFCNPSI